MKGHVMFRTVFAAAVLTLLMVFPHAAQAVTGTIYDDFNGPSIDPSKWLPYSIGTSAALFSQSGGALDFASSTASSQYLVTTQTFGGDSQVGVQFYNFNSTTTYSPGYAGFVSGICLGFGLPTDTIHIDRIHSVDGDWFVFYEANEQAGTLLQWGGQVQASSPNGALMLNYYRDEGRIDALYYEGSSTTYQYLGSLQPQWASTSDPGAFLLGANKIPGTTTVQLDNFLYGTLNPVPLPPSALLLAPGLIALVCTRRKLKNIISTK